MSESAVPRLGLPSWEGTVSSAIASRAELLGKVELFARLDRLALARLAAYVEPMPIEPGVVVCQQGDPGDSLYVVAGGTLGVYARGQGTHETRLSLLGHAEYFGEMALLDDAPRSATVRAEAGGELLRLERGRFIQLLEREPRIAYTIARTLCRRLRAADHTVMQSAQAITATIVQALDRLPPGRRTYVLAASVLDVPTEPVLRAVFDADAAAVARDLAVVGLGAEAPPALVHAVRERAARELGAEALASFAQEAAYQLAHRQRWEEALGVLARHGPRAAFLAVLAEALRATPPLADERTRAWIADVTDDEAVSDPELGLGEVGVSPLFYVLALALLNRALRLALPQTQGVLILALAFIPTAAVVGVDPWIVVITILATSGQ